jgi:drug/metabolite transporter (DMT)-like permease
MRGLAPPLIAAASALLLSDPASPSLWAGVATISFGVLWIGGWRRTLGKAPTRTTALALLNACVIAAYTLIDGIGVRLSGNAASYGLWLFFLIGIPIVPMVLWRRGRSLSVHLRREWWRGLCGGLLNIGVYLIVLWAMTQAPIAAVAALRETSVIFGALIGTLLLKEPFGRDRIVGACFIALGVGFVRG